MSIRIDFLFSQSDSDSLPIRSSFFETRYSVFRNCRYFSENYLYKLFSKRQECSQDFRWNLILFQASILTLFLLLLRGLFLKWRKLQYSDLEILPVHTGYNPSAEVYVATGKQQTIYIVFFFLLF